MNVQRLLISFSVVLGCILVILVSFLVIRRQRLTSQEDQMVTQTGKVALSLPEQDRLKQFAEENPNAAVEGIRSPTPVPQDTLTITARGAEPPHITLGTTKLTVINKLKRTVYLFLKNPADGKITRLGSVQAEEAGSLTVFSEEEQIPNPEFTLLVSNTEDNPENAPPVLQIPLQREP